MNQGMSAQVAHRHPRDMRDRPPLHGAGLCRWELFNTVKNCAKELGLKDRHLTVLQVHLSLLKKGPIVPGGLYMSYMSVKALCERANHMDERTFRRCEARLEELQLIRRVRSANNRRFPIRNPRTRQIEAAHGVDLTPLFEKGDELRALEVDIQERKIAWKNALTRLSAQIMDVAQRGLSEGAQAIVERLRKEIVRLRRLTRQDPPALLSLQAEIDQLSQNEIAEDTDTLKTNSSADTDKLTAKDSQNDRHIESEEKSLKDSHDDEDHLISTCANLWPRLRHAQKEFDEPPRTESQVMRLIYHYTTLLDLPSSLVGDALAHVGQLKVISTLDKMVSSRVSIVKPRRYFISAIENSTREGAR